MILEFRPTWHRKSISLCIAKNITLESTAVLALNEAI